MTIYNIKIKVIKCVNPEFIFDDNVPLSSNGEKYTVCQSFKEGETFISKNMQIAEEFCGYA